MNVLIFEDQQVANLNPLAIGRPAYAISCGGFQLVDWLRELPGTLSGLVRPHLDELQQLDYPDLQPLDANEPWTLLVNARLVPSLAHFQNLRQLSDQPQTLKYGAADCVAAAMMPTERLSAKPQLAELSDVFGQLSGEPAANLNFNFELLEFPHDVIRAHLRCFESNLGHRIETGDYQQLTDGLFVASGAETGEGLVVDSSRGPVVLDRRAQIGPHCFLRGPVYLGPGSRVIEHSSIKDLVSLGHTTKIGGEVEGSIIEAFTNKQHHGFLGHSYLGSWINWGAGTCNSDLKNTYGEVRMEYQGQKVSTGMQFVGCMIGDYAKTAINTGIFTGKTIGVCSMLYGFVTSNVPSFVNYAKSFGQVTEMPPAVMAATQQRMFARRKVQQRPCDVRLIHDMYELTRPERQLAEDSLAQVPLAL